MNGLLACCLLLPGAVTQEPLREGIFGEVRAADAKAWAGASVTLLHVAHPGLTDPRFLDRVTATTDERGRFRAQLLAGMTYAAFATEAVTANTFRCSQVATGVVSGVPVLLQEDEVRWRRQVRLQLDASWQGDVQLLAMNHIGGFTLREVVAVADGLATLPPFPVASAGVEVLVDGLSVFRSSVPVTLAALQARHRRLADDATAAPPSEDALRQELAAPHVLIVPPRAAHVLRLRDAAQRPVVGARVVEEGREPRRLLGVSDADGIVRHAHVVGGKPPYRSLVLADGCAETVVEAEDWVALGDGGQRDKVLGAGNTVRGRLLDLEGVAAAGQPLLLEGSISTGEGSTFFGVDTRCFFSTRDGSFAVPGRIATHSWYLLAVLTPQQRARFAGKTKAPVSAVALLVPPGDAEKGDVGELRLDRLRALDLRVVAADGGSPGPVAIVMIPSPRGVGERNAPHEPLAARTDRTGRVRVLASEGIEFAVWAMGDAGAAWKVALVGGEEHELRLDPAHAIDLRLVDKEDRPLGKATAHVVVPVGTPQGEGAPALMPRLHDAFLVHGFPFKQAEADAQGRVRLVMPFVGVGIDVVFQHERQRMRRTIPATDLVPGQPLTVVFEANSR